MIKLDDAEISRVLREYKQGYRFVEEAELIDENTLAAKIRIPETFYYHKDLGHFAWAELALPSNQLGYLFFEAKRKQGALGAMISEEMQEVLSQNHLRFIAAAGEFKFSGPIETAESIPAIVRLVKYRKIKDGIFCVLDYDYGNGAAKLELKAKLLTA